MSLSQASYKYVGEFNAKTIAKTFNGAKPRELGQLFEEPPKIAINLKTAEIRKVVSLAQHRRLRRVLLSLF